MKPFRARNHGLAAALLTLAVGGFLGGCSLFEGEDEDPYLKACPQLVPVVDAMEVTRFQGSGRDLTDAEFEAGIVDVKGECELDDDEIATTMAVTLFARRGPADDDRRVSFRYFVAIADNFENVLAREEFGVTLEFEGNRTQIGYRDEIEPTIPIKEGQSGRDFRIYVGLVLSAEELERNRQNR
ncbi:MAG: hypothetical protein WDZ84_04815 [Rhodovibrionaceae bacterium]